MLLIIAADGLLAASRAPGREAPQSGGRLGGRGAVPAPLAVSPVGARAQSRAPTGRGERPQGADGSLTGHEAERLRRGVGAIASRVVSGPVHEASGVSVSSPRGLAVTGPGDRVGGDLLCGPCRVGGVGEQYRCSPAASAPLGLGQEVVLARAGQDNRAARRGMVADQGRQDRGLAFQAGGVNRVDCKQCMLDLSVSPLTDRGVTLLAGVNRRGVLLGGGSSLAAEAIGAGQGGAGWSDGALPRAGFEVSAACEAPWRRERDPACAAFDAGQCGRGSAPGRVLVAAEAREARGFPPEPGASLGGLAPGSPGRGSGDVAGLSGVGPVGGSASLGDAGGAGPVRRRRSRYDQPRCAVCGIEFAEGERRLIQGDGEFCSACFKVASAQREPIVAAARRANNGAHDLAAYMMALRRQPDLPRLQVPQELVEALSRSVGPSGEGVRFVAPLADRGANMVSIIAVYASNALGPLPGDPIRSLDRGLAVELACRRGPVAQAGDRSARQAVLRVDSDSTVG